MSKFTLYIHTDNSAFEEDGVDEIVRILRDAAKRMEEGDFYMGHTRNLLDYNGNTVGGYKWSNSND